MIRWLVLWVGAVWLVLLAVLLLAGRARPLATDTVFINDETTAGGFRAYPQTYSDLRLGLHLVHESPGALALNSPRLRDLQPATERQALLWAASAPTADHLIYATADSPVQVVAYDPAQRTHTPLLARRYDSQLACSPLDAAWCLIYATRIGKPVDLLHLDTLATRTFPAIWENPTWSPTDLRFAAPNVTTVNGPRTVDELDVVIVDAVDGGRAHVCNIGQSGRVSFNWSPDGAWLLVHASASLDRNDIPARNYLFPADDNAGGGCPRLALPVQVSPQAGRQLVWATSSRALYLPRADGAYVYNLEDARWRPVR